MNVISVRDLSLCFARYVGAFQNAQVSRSQTPLQVCWQEQAEVLELLASVIQHSSTDIADCKMAENMA